MPREFTTAARKASEDDDKAIEFLVDGVTMHAYRPEPGQLAVMMASFASYSTVIEKTAGIINFFVGVLDEESHQILVGRLLDRTDPFDLEQVEEIMEWMVEEWAGRPTQPLSASTQSQRNGGRRSTASAPRTGSTRSSSTPIASAT
jgi:hypothetical protein